MTDKQPEALRLADWCDEHSWGMSHPAKDAAAELRRQHQRIAELEGDMQFVERWAVHHGTKPHMDAVQALGIIQHYPAISAITHSYTNGKTPDTFNPYVRIAELEAKLAQPAEPVAELEALRKQVQLTEYLFNMDGLRELQTDKARLDWLETHGVIPVDSVSGKTGGNGQKCVAAYRSAIDAAIAQAVQHGK